MRLIMDASLGLTNYGRSWAPRFFKGRVLTEHGIGFTIYPAVRSNWVCPAPGAGYGMHRVPNGCCAACTHNDNSLCHKHCL